MPTLPIIQFLISTLFLGARRVSVVLLVSTTGISLTFCQDCILPLQIKNLKFKAISKFSNIKKQQKFHSITTYRRFSITPVSPARAEQLVRACARKRMHKTFRVLWRSRARHGSRKRF